MRSHEDLAEVRRWRRILLLRSSSSTRPLARSRSVDDIVEAVHLPAEISVLALPLHTAQSFAEELPIELRDEMPLVRALGSASLRGRLRCMSQEIAELLLAAKSATLTALERVENARKELARPPESSSQR